MTNQIRNNNKCIDCLKQFLGDFFYKLYDKNIMVDNSIGEEFGKNRETFIKLSINKRKQVVDSMSDIFDYNPDFNKIGIDYLVNQNQIISSQNLAELIKEEHKYKYYKAFMIAVIKALLILSQLCISILFLYPKFDCIDSLKDPDDNKYWINSNKKCKVITIKTDAIWILKLIYFVVYDVVYFINVFYFLINFERKKLNKYIIIVYQSLG